MRVKDTNTPSRIHTFSGVTGREGVGWTALGDTQMKLIFVAEFRKNAGYIKKVITFQRVMTI